MSPFYILYQNIYHHFAVSRNQKQFFLLGISPPISINIRNAFPFSVKKGSGVMFMKETQG
jgi:hypothetical protein